MVVYSLRDGHNIHLYVFTSRIKYIQALSTLMFLSVAAADTRMLPITYTFFTLCS